MPPAHRGRKSFRQTLTHRWNSHRQHFAHLAQGHLNVQLEPGFKKTTFWLVRHSHPQPRECLIKVAIWGGRGRSQPILLASGSLGGFTSWSYGNLQPSKKSEWSGAGDVHLSLGVLRDDGAQEVERTPQSSTGGLHRVMVASGADLFWAASCSCTHQVTGWSSFLLKVWDESGQVLKINQQSFKVNHEDQNCWLSINILLIWEQQSATNTGWPRTRPASLNAGNNVCSAFFFFLSLFTEILSA